MLWSDVQMNKCKSFYSCKVEQDLPSNFETPSCAKCRPHFLTVGCGLWGWFRAIPLSIDTEEEAASAIRTMPSSYVPSSTYKTCIIILPRSRIFL